MNAPLPKPAFIVGVTPSGQEHLNRALSEPGYPDSDKSC